MKYTFTEQHRQNISKALRGKRNHLGHKHSEQTKLLFHLARIGKEHPRSSDTNVTYSRIRSSYWARFTPEERKQKTEHLREATRGKPISLEHRLATSKGIKASMTDEEKKRRSLVMLGNSYGLGYKFTLEQCLAASESRKGEKSHLWLGGISFEPYPPDFNNNIKLRVRIRDNFTCQLCYIPENGHKHNVHHIDYNKANNIPDNLITLCNSCHTKTNQNRDYWQNYFEQSIYDHFNRRNSQ